jgi:hypothetical protein
MATSSFEGVAETVICGSRTINKKITVVVMISTIHNVRYGIEIRPRGFLS